MGFELYLICGYPFFGPGRTLAGYLFSAAPLSRFLFEYILTAMFSRVATTVARAPARVAARRLTSRAAAAVSTQGSSAGLAAAAAACAAAGIALAAVQPESSLCTAPAFKYTGEPGTVHERSFIVS